MLVNTYVLGLDQVTPNEGDLEGEPADVYELCTGSGEWVNQKV